MTLVSTIEITHPEKVLFPKSGITKLELAEYYSNVAAWMLPHLKGRPITMQRFPNGIGGPGFYAKDASEFPDFVKKARVKLKSGESKCNALVENVETLAFLANQSNIPIHTWLSRKGNLNRPDMVIWDLDPTDGDFEKVRESAWIMNKYLEERGISPWLKTAGSRGVHIVVPIEPDCTFVDTRNIARQVSEKLAKENQKLLTTEMVIKDRGKKVFVDYLRNGFAQTAAAPYSVRAKENAPVAMPITWKELEDKKLTSQNWHIRNAIQRLKKSGDIWKDMYKSVYRLKDLEI